jgi:hypothetical protein
MDSIVQKKALREPSQLVSFSPKIVALTFPPR